MTQQAIIRHLVPISNNKDDATRDDVRFILRTDGTGILIDLYYDDQVTITHDIDLLGYSKAGTINLTDLRKIPYVSEFNTDFPLAEDERNSGDDQNARKRSSEPFQCI